MERLNNKPRTASQWFVIAGLVLLLTGMLFGVLGGLQYVIPGLFRSGLSFEKVRPLHVSSVVFWIIFSATGSVLTYINQHKRKNSATPALAKWQLALFILAVIGILTSYILGKFGGREYWEFPPMLALPFVAGWVLFLINFIRNIRPLKNQPVYVWMWTTGVIAFLFTYVESYLWIFPYFRNSIITDMTIQWKSYGSMVGAWNMLIYGCGMFLMEKISGHQTYSRSKTAFALYFLGLFNLMFNWGHHIYTLPTSPYIKHVSYLVSMTELLILGRIIYRWKYTVADARKHYFRSSYRLLLAADTWVFLTLSLAILMSIPGINLYTHGTHITVAHTMGATIGINTFMLLAIACDVLEINIFSNKWSRYAYLTANFSLFGFWLSLIGAGIMKSIWQMSATPVPFSQMMENIRPFLLTFVIFGFILMASIALLIWPLLKYSITNAFSKNNGAKYKNAKSAANDLQHS